MTSTATRTRTVLDRADAELLQCLIYEERRLASTPSKAAEWWQVRHRRKVLEAKLAERGTQL